jgi:aspartate racemase
VIADINPEAPDRNVPGTQAGVVLAEMAGGLQGAGAQVLAIPCNTAHAHASLIQRACGLPLIDMIDLGAEAAQRSGAMRAGVLGTKGALKLYREYLAARAMGLVTLPQDSQDAFMETIYRIKAGDRSEEVRLEMQGYAAELKGLGADILIAGCTEAPLVMSKGDTRLEMIDPGDLLARRAVGVCMGWDPLPLRQS